MTKRSCANFWPRPFPRSSMRRLSTRECACTATRTTDISGSRAILSVKDWSLSRVTADTDSNLPRCWVRSLPTQRKEKIILYSKNSDGDRKCVPEPPQMQRDRTKTVAAVSNCQGCVLNGGKFDARSAAAAACYFGGLETAAPCCSLFGCRFSSVICLMRAESDGLHVATSGSSLKALWTRRRS